jgi:hypothetical protein
VRVPPITGATLFITYKKERDEGTGGGGTTVTPIPIFSATPIPIFTATPTPTFNPFISPTPFGG